MNSSKILLNLLPDITYREKTLEESKDDNLTSEPVTTPTSLVILFESDGWTSFLTGIIFWLAVIVSCSACCRTLCKTMFCEVPKWIKNDLCSICFPERSEYPPETRQIIQNIGEAEIMLNSIQIDQVPTPSPPRYDIALSMPKPDKDQQAAAASNINNINSKIDSKSDSAPTSEHSIGVHVNCRDSEGNSSCMCNVSNTSPGQSLPPPTYNQALEIIRQQEEATQNET